MTVYDEDKGQQTRGSAAIVDLAVSVGTASDTIVDVGGAFNQTTLNNVIRSLAAKINEQNAQLRAAGIIPQD